MHRITTLLLTLRSGRLTSVCTTFKQPWKRQQIGDFVSVFKIISFTYVCVCVCHIWGIISTKGLCTRQGRCDLDSDTTKLNHSISWKILLRVVSESAVPKLGQMAVKKKGKKANWKRTNTKVLKDPWRSALIWFSDKLWLGWASFTRSLTSKEITEV